MDNNYKMKPNETIREYVDRIVMLKDQIGTWADVAMLINSETGEIRSADSYRKRYQTNKKNAETYSGLVPKNEQEGILCNSENAKRYLELKSLKQQVQDEKRVINGLIREEGRMDSFQRDVLSALEKHYAPSKAKIQKISSKKNDRAGILVLADVHYGKDFTLYDFDGNVQNAYSEEICQERLNKVLTETKKIVTSEKFKQIDVFSLGDLIEGDLRPQTRYALRHTAPEQVVMIGSFLAKWFEEMSRFVKVRYHQTSGNHGDVRLDGDKKGQDPRNNFEPIIETMIEFWNKNNPNFECVKNPTGFAFENIVGYNVLGIHGEVPKLEKAILEYSNFYNTRIDYLVAGHKHNQHYKNTGEKRGFIGAGSIVGSDTYSKQLRRVSDANATFLILEKDKGLVENKTIPLN